MELPPLDPYDMAPELCVCSAILTEHGSTVVGRRHCDCLAYINRNGHKQKSGPSWQVQDFVTSLGRYVDRREAYLIQRAAGVPSASPEGYRDGIGELFSEDLY